MTVPVTPIVFIVLGALLWAFARPPKLSEAGKIVFAVGVLALAFGGGSAPLLRL